MCVVVRIKDFDVWDVIFMRRFIGVCGCGRVVVVVEVGGQLIRYTGKI